MTSQLQRRERQVIVDIPTPHAPFLDIKHPSPTLLTKGNSVTMQGVEGNPFPTFLTNQKCYFWGVRGRQMIVTDHEVPIHIHSATSKRGPEWAFSSHKQTPNYFHERILPEYFWNTSRMLPERILTITLNEHTPGHFQKSLRITPQVNMWTDTSTRTNTNHNFSRKVPELQII